MLVFQDSIHSNIQITKGVNIHNSFQKIILKEILQKISIFLPYQNLLQQSNKTYFKKNFYCLISKKSIELSSP